MNKKGFLNKIYINKNNGGLLKKISTLFLFFFFFNFLFSQRTEQKQVDEVTANSDNVYIVKGTVVYGLENINSKKIVVEKKHPQPKKAISPKKTVKLQLAKQSHKKEKKIPVIKSDVNFVTNKSGDSSFSSTKYTQVLGLENQISKKNFNSYSSDRYKRNSFINTKINSKTYPYVFAVSKYLKDSLQVRPPPYFHQI